MSPFRLHCRIGPRPAFLGVDATVKVVGAAPFCRARAEVFRIRLVRRSPLFHPQILRKSHKYNRIGLPEYYALEAFVRWDGGPI